MRDLKSDAMEIVKAAIRSAQVERTLRAALKDLEIHGRVVCVAIGKAAWEMAKVASEVLGDAIHRGIVITKYHHGKGSIPGFETHEAGHPLPDENSLRATKRAVELVEDLGEDDTVLFLVSGGGSALFELPLPGVSLSEMVRISDELLKSGADIVEFNAVRKHLSAVKGGRFAQMCRPAKVYNFILSDVIGGRLDMVASGPTLPDLSTSEDALHVLEKYDVKVGEGILKAIAEETPKELDNVAETKVIGSVEQACEAAMEKACELGYNAMILTTSLACEAREAGRFLGAVAREISQNERPLKKPAAVICGGETVVKVRGEGKGGRNQELALSFAIEARGMKEIALASIGTDGTDGPTDAAGGLVDGGTAERIDASGKSAIDYLEENDSYHALKMADALVITGPTGTNVNDVVVLLVG